MADIQEAIRRLRYIFSSEGADKVAADQEKVATTFEQTDKASLSLDKSFSNLERRYVSTVKAQQDYQKVQNQVNAAVQQNPALQDRANAILSQAAERYGQAGVASRAFAAATSGVSGQLIALSAGAGPVGTFLAALGPWGLAASIGLGAVTAAMEAQRRAANDLANTAVQLHKFSEETGLSTDQLQALTAAAAKHGVATDEAVGAIVRFTSAWGELRNGTGDFLTKLRAIDSGLADQLQRTKDVTTAIGLYVQAIQKADGAGDISTRNALLRAGGGRGGVAALVGISASVGEAGGVDALTKQYTDAHMAVSAGLLADLQKLKIEIEENRKVSDQLFASIGAKPILEADAAWEKMRVRVALNAVEMAKIENQKPFWTWFFDKLAQTSDTGSLVPPVAQYASSLPASPVGKVSSGGDLPNLTAPMTLKAQAEAIKDLILVLGSAATIEDRRNAKLAELNATLDLNKNLESQRGRIIASINLDAVIEKLNLYNSALGAGATVSDTVAAKVATLQKQQQQGAGLDDTQYANAKRLIQAQADGTYALQAQIDSTRIQAQTYDMAAGAAETFRIVQTKVNENLNAGRPALDGISQEFYKLANAAGAGAQALEAVRVKSTITFGQRTAFLTPEDVQIATQLKGLYGNDIPAAMQSSEAAALRLNNAMSTTSQQISGGLTTALVDVSMGTKSAGDAFRDFALLAIRAIQQMIIQLMVVGPLMRSLQSSMGGGFNIFSLFGGASGPGTAGNSMSGIAGDPTAGGTFLTAGHTGGIVGSLSMQRYVNSANDNGLHRYHTGGTVGPQGAMADGQRLVVAKDGEEIGWPDQLAQKYGRAAPAGSGGNDQSVSLSVTNHNDFRGVDPSMRAFIVAQQRKQNQETKQEILAEVAGLSRNAPGYIRKAG
jgi:hypothetical protein